MKKMALTLSLAVIAATITTSAEAPADQKAIAMEGVRYIKMLGKELKSNVMKRMKDDPSGLQSAYFCSKSAERITKEINAKFPKGIRVRRTALKIRNPKNAPDATDLKVLKKMEAESEEGTLKKKPVVVQVEDVNRVYVPLFVEKGCLKCHGPVDRIDPKVRKLLAEKYPHDQAVGFKKGDLRGVVVAEIPVEK
ncbi:Tll0287-like domain-containing protein [Nitratifractor sp.]